MQVTTVQVGELQTNCYILTAGNDAVVIDPGAEGERLFQLLGDRNLLAILLTHGHADHIAALNPLREPTGAPVYIHADDAEMLTDSQANLSWMMSIFTTQPADQLLTDGQELAFGDISLRVIHTPGHTRGGVCFDDGVDNLFVGDTLFCESIGRTDFPGGDMNSLCTSVKEKLFPLGDRSVYPGHGPVTTLAHERRNNPFLG